MMEITREVLERMSKEDLKEVMQTEKEELIDKISEKALIAKLSLLIGDIDKVSKTIDDIIGIIVEEWEEDDNME